MRGHHRIDMSVDLHTAMIVVSISRKPQSEKGLQANKSPRALRLNLQDMADNLFVHISHYTNYIHTKFHVPRAIFYHFIKKNIKL